MKTYLECIPCFAQQAWGAVRLATDDQEIQAQVMRNILVKIARMDMSASPPEMGGEMHRLIRDMANQADPYKDIKQQYNRFALDAYPRLKQRIKDSGRSFETAVRLAIAGNIIDFGANLDVDQALVDRTVKQSLTEPLLGGIDIFAEAVCDARNILYLADNTGEIVFDRLLIEEIGPDRVTVAVRGGPVINDATMDDARFCGLTDMVAVIDNGADIPGTVLSACSESFSRAFHQADLIIAKGQGNYETLSNMTDCGHIFFLFKTKCAVAARDVGCEIGRFVVKKMTKP